jgi:hypothetical protein
MLTMKSNLYNPDGTLSVEAQSLLSPKPADVSVTERRKAFQAFDAKLTVKEVAEFKQLKRLKWNGIGGSNQTKEQRKEIDKQNYYRDPLKHIRRGTARAKVRYNTDPLYRIKQKLRWALRDAFKRIKKSKSASTEKMLGCSYLEAKAHFESLFSEGMSWENHGDWHIDHIRPVCSFSDKELHLMNHISNLQPLWAEDNFAKADQWNKGDLSNQSSEDICTVEEVQETRGTQKENNRSTGCRTP